jgi:hypothetical protein
VGLADSSIKLVGQSGLPPYEIVAFLGLFTSTTLGAYTLLRGNVQALRPTASDAKLLVLASIWQIMYAWQLRYAT